MKRNQNAVLLCLGIALTVLFLPLSTHAAAAPECRNGQLSDGTDAMFCKDRKGNWQQQRDGAPKAASSTPSVRRNVDAQFQGT